MEKNKLKSKQRIGVNALFLKNPLTGVAKRALSFYSRIPRLHQGTVVIFLTPYPLSSHTLEYLREYGIDFSRPEYRITVTPVWGLRVPVFCEIAEWWWLHYHIPLICHSHNITIYEAPWSRGLPFFFPYRIVSMGFRLFKLLTRYSSLDFKADIKKPYMILTVHDLIPLYPLTTTDSNSSLIEIFADKFHRLYHQIQAISYRRRMGADLNMADKVITVSPQVHKDILRYFPKVKSDKLVVISNGIDGVDKFKRERKNQNNEKNCLQYIKENGLSNSAGYKFLNEINELKGNKKHGKSMKFFLYVGGFNPRKNLPRFLFALKNISKEKMSDYMLVLLGKENRYFRQVIFPLVRNHPFPIVRLGYIPDKALCSLYRGAEFLCYPSMFEGFGMPPIEALSRGIRVVIDRNLPINGGYGGVKNGEGSFVVAKFKQQFPKDNIDDWWKDRVIVVDGSDINDITSALKRTMKLISSDRIKGKRGINIPNMIKLWGKKSPFIWDNLAKEYARFIGSITS